MKRPPKPLPPKPPVARTLTEADLEAIREITRASVADVGRALRDLLNRPQRRGGCA